MDTVAPPPADSVIAASLFYGWKAAIRATELEAENADLRAALDKADKP